MFLHFLMWDAIFIFFIVHYILLYLYSDFKENDSYHNQVQYKFSFGDSHLCFRISKWEISLLA